MPQTISAARVATLVGDFDRPPPTQASRRRAGAAHRRRPDRARHPAPQRARAHRRAGVSRTTVTRAYAELRDAGYAAARQGSGTFTWVPGGRARAHDRALLPAPATPTRSTSTARRRRHRPGWPRRTPRRPTCRRTSAGTATSRPGCPSCAARDRGVVRRPRAAHRPRPGDGDAGAPSAAAVLSLALTSPGERVLVESPTT